jgi:hypothetical protein
MNVKNIKTAIKTDHKRRGPSFIYKLFRRTFVFHNKDTLLFHGNNNNNNSSRTPSKPMSFFAQFKVFIGYGSMWYPPPPQWFEP